MNPIPVSPTPTVDLSRARRRLAAPALAVAFIFLLTTLLQILFSQVTARFFPAFFDKSYYVWIASSLPMYAISMPLSLFLWKIEPGTAPKKEKLRTSAFLGLIALCFAMTYLGNYLGQLVNILIGRITGEIPDFALQEVALSSPLWANLLFCGILAPIMEEIFYRKLIIDRLLHFGELPAVLISGILFGLIHGNFSQFFYAAMIGMLFGYVYLRTGNILYTIALHMCVNLVGGVYSTEMLKRLDLEALSNSPSAQTLADNAGGILMMLLYLLFMFTCLVGAIVAACLLYKRIRFVRAEIALTGRQWASVLLLNPAVWVLTVVILLLFFV